ncbi:hypothetical protein RHMOL_Rhmol12G0191400 [Rhododendron molle]|uniref:Uncharacterized protein n=1 Tax=Rhododendron molle TaxID=49168 RepID=A0ACC0LKC4_RHOML|nr:hypothetical protein RHMOL_Rhmol12G0191400 [Rhododendron molle]
MLAFRNSVSAITPPLSFGTFIKHLPTLIPAALNPNRINHRTLTTAAVRSSTHFQTLTSRQKEQIHLYVDALLDWNQKMNLTAVTEASEVIRERAEFLGLNILLTFPDYGAYSEPCYRQNLGQNLGFREVFDVAVARAVAEMRVLAEYCLPLVRVGGLFVAAKGHDPLEEVRRAETAIRLMGASVLEMCSVESQGPHGQRTAVVCLKERPTPRKYPRDPGTPVKSPM